MKPQSSPYNDPLSDEVYSNHSFGADSARANDSFRSPTAKAPGPLPLAPAGGQAAEEVAAHLVIWLIPGFLHGLLFQV
jgi:hypothetical protein